MKAVRVHTPGGPDALRYEDVPEPTPKPGHARREGRRGRPQLHRRLLSQRTLQGRTADHVAWKAGGTVAAVGPGVTQVKVGDKVAYTGVPGSYAEYALVPADRLVVLPAGLTHEARRRRDAAGHDRALSRLQHLAARSPGEACLVHAAAGGVGLLLCQIAKMRGARVIGTVSTEDKAKLAREAGADEVILYSRQDFVAEVKRLTGGKGLQVVYDSVGKDTFERGFDCLAPRGMMVLYGQSSGPVGPFDVGKLGVGGSLFLTRPSLVAYTATREELEQRAGDVLGWVRDGKLTMRMEFEFPLKDAAEAHRALEGRRTTGKVLLVP